MKIRVTRRRGGGALQLWRRRIKERRAGVDVDFCLCNAQPADSNEPFQECRTSDTVTDVQSAYCAPPTTNFSPIQSDSDPIEDDQDTPEEPESSPSPVLPPHWLSRMRLKIHIARLSELRSPGLRRSSASGRLTDTHLTRPCSSLFPTSSERTLAEEMLRQTNYPSNTPTKGKAVQTFHRLSEEHHSGSASLKHTSGFLASCIQ
ncbi:hypothetical protein F2P81_020813 [Scophthalmus maximus]|uniref:Uncharacterized protein n=1 Tax=Scophthalmus maximus TaxID=52904 RepID=A0A6A4RTR8_SCOMX|nr:hypothetical protein F2P81_020813 [Scophthalmus maximus]